jgi:hypothetical protein
VGPPYQNNVTSVLSDLRTADVVDFVENECLPVELAGLKSGGRTMDEQITAMEDLKRKARKRGLWNLFLSQKHYPKNVPFCLTKLRLTL